MSPKRQNRKPKIGYRESDSEPPAFSGVGVSLSDSTINFSTSTPPRRSVRQQQQQEPPPGRSSKPTKPLTRPKSSPSTPPELSSTSPIYFWKPNEDPYGPFCQWYESPIRASLISFTDDPPSKSSPPTIYTFNTSEQYMMAHKAHLFSPDDTASFDEILATTCPRTQRALGRLIPNFSEDVWVRHRFEIVKWGNYHKFTQDEKLKELLLGTGNREIVEASPKDRVWGVGFGAKNAEKNRDRWGLNLLGKVLMEVREKIREQAKEREKGKEKN